MGLGELREPMQEKELLALFSKKGASWMTRKEMALRRDRLGICGLVRVPAVPVSKDLPEAGEYAPFRSGLFRPLRSPAYEGSWSAQGCLLQRVGEEEAAGQERKMLDFRGVLLKKRRGSRSAGVSSASKEGVLFPKKGGRRRRVKRPRKSAMWLRLYTLAIPQSSW